ncbi:hypothetical protein FFZ99_00035 [Leptospira interrogans]|nr:hypothetical protein B2G47_09350 [Leptospira interrogans serovar Canicola]TQE60310.1 hypothetical protein FF006_02690 [Leptospira interrogans]TQE65755.1 hypothetical protein FFZ99_00035 [Leptospira interrogans]TQE68042.1 hypothetical protein FF001_04310 [Leptospira interrogans]TQE74055.1 hypothetical protein FF002_07245 [Leptospira interrogans]
MGVPTLEYDRFNCYKLLFYKLWEFPHLKNRSCKIQIPTFFRIMSFLCQTYVSLVDYFSVEKLNF